MKDTYSHYISQTWSDIAICCHSEQRCASCTKSFFWVFKGLRERTLKISSKLLFILLLEDFHHMWHHKTSFFFSFNDDCLNYWVLKEVYNRFVAYRFRVWLFNNPTPRHHYFPIWNMCRYFQTQSLALRAKYNISHVSFILNAPVEAINNTCHCTEKIPFEIGNFFLQWWSIDQ